MKTIINYLKQNQLILSSAESCTAGQILSLLAHSSGCGACVDVGYVVYSETAKRAILKVKKSTINQYTLTSEEVAREMVIGTFYKSRASVVVATTGIAGSKPMNGKKPGTICFSWGFKLPDTEEITLFSETKIFEGSRSKIQKQAAQYSLESIPRLHQNIIRTN